MVLVTPVLTWNPTDLICFQSEPFFFGFNIQKDGNWEFYIKDSKDSSFARLKLSFN